jgi:3-deoxy-D-manno-octulosonic-acid transferase
LKATDPDELILVETDIWPGILDSLKHHKIPSSLVSARLSPRSYRNYRRIRFFWKKVLNLFTHIAVQTEEDEDKFLQLGALESQLKVTGNLKFDQQVEELSPNIKETILKECNWPEGRYILAGSTHPSEEILILETFLEISKEIPDLKLVIAPRNRSRFGLTWRLIQDMVGDAAMRRTKSTEIHKNPSVFLLDTLGELDRFYSLCDIAIIGKSFPGPHEGGGHNPLEPASKAKPVLSGPRCHNFKWMYNALSECGAAEIVTKDTLGPRLKAILNDPELLKSMGEKGREFILTHQGSAKKTLAFIDPENFQNDTEEGPEKN